METAILTFLTVSAALLLLGSPVLIISWIRDRRDTTRNFLVSAGVVAVACGLIALVSERQVAQCQAAGNPDCIDAGASGLQFLFIGGYLVTSWIVAKVIYDS